MSLKIIPTPFKLLFLATLAVASCSPDLTPPPSGPVTEELLKRIPEKEPDWVYVTKEIKDDENLFFVGISKKFREERDARSDARNDAGSLFVQYCGVEAELFSEYLSESVGLSSEVLDATESIKERSKLRSEAYFSRLKVQETSTEIYREVQSEKEIGRFYRIKVLARIPKSEYQRVQEWKKKKDEQREAIARQVLDEKLTVAESLEERGLVLRALVELEGLISKAKKKESSQWEVYLTKAEKIRSQMLGGLKIIPAGPQSISMRPLEETPPLKVRVVILKSGEKTQSVPKFPVVFKRGDQKKTEMTRSDGSASLIIEPPESEGRFLITAAADPNMLDDSFPKDALKAIKSQSIDFQIEVRADYIEGLKRSDYQLGLAGIKSGEELKLDDEFDLSISCSRRCRVRLYYWDGLAAKLLYKYEKRRLGKKKTIRTPKIKADKSGEYKIIAISTSDSFSDDAEINTRYDSNEFGLLLKNFRSSTKPVAERHLNITVIR